MPLRLDASIAGAAQRKHVLLLVLLVLVVIVVIV